VATFGNQRAVILMRLAECQNYLFNTGYERASRKTRAASGLSSDKSFSGLNMRLDKANRNIYDKCAEPASQEG